MNTSHKKNMAEHHTPTKSVLLLLGKEAEKQLGDLAVHLVLSPTTTPLMPAITPRKQAIKKSLMKIHRLGGGQNGQVFDAVVKRDDVFQSLLDNVVIKTVLPPEDSDDPEQYEIDKALEDTSRARLYGEYTVHSRINYLRKFIPNFALLIGAYSCLEAESEKEIEKGELCDIELEAKKSKKVPEVHLILEKIGPVPDDEEDEEDPKNKAITLEEVLDKYSSFDEKTRRIEFLKVMLQVACAIAIAQDKLELVHGDLHPENVMVVPIPAVNPFDGKPLAAPRRLKGIPGQRVFLKYPLPGAKPIHIIGDNLAVLLDFGLARIKGPDDGVIRTAFKPKDATLGLSRGFNQLYDLHMLFKRCTGLDHPKFKGLFPKTDKFLDSFDFEVTPFREPGRIGFPKYKFSKASGGGALSLTEALIQRAKADDLSTYTREEYPDATALKFIEVLLDEAKELGIYDDVCKPRMEEPNKDVIVEFKLE